MKRTPSSAARAHALRARPGLQRDLLRWFRRARRELPWRQTRDPYAIWLSESMLQQTRVETVVPFYRRFLARFPDVAALAGAEEEEVLAQWSGLGYYSRARALLRAARTIVSEHAGVPPRTRAQWLALPGVGPYTAGAVLSIAFSAAEPLVDGNVQRVFARLFALEAPQGSRALVDECWALARALLPAAASRRDPGEWNQALMELGARVCTPRAPSCERCPLRSSCRAHAAGRARELPRPKPRRPLLAVRLEILVVRSRAGLLCVRRPERGRMAGLFEFPTREIAPAGARPRLWPAELPAGLALEPLEPLGELVHAITHHRLRAPAGTRWTRAGDGAELPLTGLARKVLALAPVAARGSAPEVAG